MPSAADASPLCLATRPMGTAEASLHASPSPSPSPSAHSSSPEGAATSSERGTRKAATPPEVYPSTETIASDDTTRLTEVSTSGNSAVSAAPSHSSANDARKRSREKGSEVFGVEA